MGGAMRGPHSREEMEGCFLDCCKMALWLGVAFVVLVVIGELVF